MEKYLADRLYALIYRMCQVQAFSSRLRARGFPAIGKYGPKTPPRTAGVTKYVIGFGRCSGFVRHFCREGPILRNPETGRTSLPRSQTRGRSALSPAAFPVLSPGARYVPGRIQCPGNSSLFFSLVFRRVPELQLAGAFRSPGSETERCGSFGCRIGPECRLLSGQAAVRTVPPRRRHPIPLGRIRQSYISLCGEHTRPGVAISPSRGLRLTDRVSDRFRPRGLRRRKKARARKPEASETHKPAGHIV